MPKYLIVLITEAKCLVRRLAIFLGVRKRAFRDLSPAEQREEMKRVAPRLREADRLAMPLFAQQLAERQSKEDKE